MSPYPPPPGPPGCPRPSSSPTATSRRQGSPRWRPTPRSCPGATCCDGPVPADLPLRILSGLRARWLAQEVDLERAEVEAKFLARDLRFTLLEPGSEVMLCLVPPEFPWMAPAIARLLEELPGPDGPSARRCARSRPAGRGRHPVQARRRAGGG